MGVMNDENTPTKRLWKFPEGLEQYDKSGYLWIKIDPIVLNSQTEGNRAGGLKLGGKGEDSFLFMAPNSIQETHNHSWEPYQTIMSKIVDKYKGAKQIGQEYKALKGGVKGLIDAAQTAKAQGTTSLAQVVGKVTGNATNIGINNTTKIDAPLVYSDSDRREYNFTFNLVAIGRNDKTKVLDAVRKLQWYAAPDINSKNNNFDIKLPYIWQVRSTPVEMVKLNYCVLSSIQPTYYEPYVDGYPIKCELTLTFKDFSPLYKTTISQGGIKITVS